ncbi:MAG: chorismate mutase [Alphaproteobacteria bacterium]
MASSGPTLDALRREIDEIDDGIHDLLMRRTAVVEKVRSHKGSDNGPFLRPAREAAILRRLVQRHTGNFPVAALVHIWREIMSALVRLQGPFSVAVFAPAEFPHYWDLARDHFGASTPMTRFSNVEQVVRAAGESGNTVGVLPWPHESKPEPWWRHLASEEPDALRVISRLPFLATGRPDDPQAVAVAQMPQEPSGADRSLLAIATQAELSRSRFLSSAKAAGFAPQFVSEWQDSEPGAAWWYLIEIGEFLAADDPRLERLREAPDGSIWRVVRVGGYAEPLGGAQAAGSGTTRRA